MTSPGFLPTRQLVLVDLLALMLATRPGERAVVAVDGADDVGRARLVAELLALAPHVAGREVLSVAVDRFRRPDAPRDRTDRTAESHYRDTYDYDALRARVLRPFTAGLEIVPAAHDAHTGHPLDPDPVEPAEDTLLLVEGTYLRRPELRGAWDATCLVIAPARVARSGVAAGLGTGSQAEMSSAQASPGGPAEDPEQGASRLYQQQARLWQPTWIVDNSDLQRPELVVPDPEEPQWFDDAQE